MEFKGQYLTYDEYITLDGTLRQTPFDLLEFEVRNKIDKYTYGRLKGLDSQVQEVKLLVFKLIELVDGYNKSELEHRGVSSENTDGYSVKYSDITTDTIKAKNKEIKGIISEYLSECCLEDGTPYLYCGADYVN